MGRGHTKNDTRIYDEGNGKCILGSNPDRISRGSSSSNVRRLVDTERDGSEMKGIVL